MVNLEELGAVLASEVGKIDVWATGYQTVDQYLLGCGGIPRGRVIEGLGTYGSGKSTFAHWLAGVGVSKNHDFTVYWCDIEGCFSSEWAAKFGQSLDQTYLSPPSLAFAEEYFESVKRAIVEGVDLIVIDSLPAMVLKSVQGSSEKSSSEALRMDESLAFSKWLSQVVMRQLLGGFVWKGKVYRLSSSRSAVYIINQLRHSPSPFESSADITPGGMAIKHMASVRLQFSRYSSSIPGYMGMEIKVVKNKVGAPFRSGRFLIGESGGLYETPDTAVEFLISSGEVRLEKGVFHVGDKVYRRKTDLLNYLSKQGRTFHLRGMEVEDGSA